MGTDYPFPWTKTAVDHILATPGLSDGERVAILEETAEKLLAVRARSGEGRLGVGLSRWLGPRAVDELGRPRMASPAGFRSFASRCADGEVAPNSGPSQKLRSNNGVRPRK